MSVVFALGAVTVVVLGAVAALTLGDRIDRAIRERRLRRAAESEPEDVW